MKKSTRFKITLTVLAVVLIISIALLVKVYRAYNGNSDTASSDTTAQTTTAITTTASSVTSATTQSATTTPRPEITTTTQTTTTTIATTTTTPEPTQIIEPVVVKARSTYLQAGFAASSTVINNIIETAKNTELNAVVIDVKEGGVVLYDSFVPEVRDNKLYQAVFDPEAVVKKLQDNGIYVIARLVVFKDNLYAQKFPDRAIKTPSGSIAKSDKSAWANPYIEANWDYNIDIAKEVASFGFDEIQFDYIRFPSAASSQVAYGEADIPAYSRARAIASFMEKAYNELKPLGVNVSADVFAIAGISDLDARAMGQRLDWMGQFADYICPMIYPSHYANSSTGIMGNGVGQNINGVHFTKPDLEPYAVVYNTLKAMEKLLASHDDDKMIAKIRPYIQDFTATYLRDGYYQTYGGEQIRQQVQAIYDAGYSEWILWNGGQGRITPGAFLPK